MLANISNPGKATHQWAEKMTKNRHPAGNTFRGSSKDDKAPGEEAPEPRGACACALLLPEAARAVKCLLSYVSSLPFMSPKMKSRITTSILGFLFLDSVRAAGGSVLPSDLVTPPCPPELRAEDPGTGESGPGRSEQPSIPALTPSGPERGVTGQASSCELGSSSPQPPDGTWQAHHQLIHSFIHSQ